MVTGDRLKSLRLKSGLSQSQISKDLDIGGRNYQRYEADEVLPNARILIKLCKYFNVSADYLLGLSDNPNRNE